MTTYDRDRQTPRLTAKAVLRLIEQERRLAARLSETREHLKAHGRRLSDSAGYRVILTGPALERLAVEKAGRAA